MTMRKRIVHYSSSNQTTVVRNICKQNCTYTIRNLTESLVIKVAGTARCARYQQFRFEILSFLFELVVVNQQSFLINVVRLSLEVD